MGRVPVIPSLVPLEEGHSGLRMLLPGISLALIWEEPTTLTPGGPPSSQSGHLLPEPPPPPILLLPFASGKQALKDCHGLHSGKGAPGCLGYSHTFVFCLGWVLLATLEHHPSWCGAYRLQDIYGGVTLADVTRPGQVHHR